MIVGVMSPFGVGLIFIIDFVYLRQRAFSSILNIKSFLFGQGHSLSPWIDDFWFVELSCGMVARQHPVASGGCHEAGVRSIYN